MQNTIRLYKTEDFEPITRLWFDAQTVAMPDMMARMDYKFDEAQAYFRNVIVLETQIWVYERDGVPLGFIAIQGELIDRLYVHPAYHRQGIGQALLVKARELLPEHIWLYTHVANKMARAFYEKNDFIAEGFGVSPAPESEPDVEYHWRAKK
ncbi:MAG: GNAT family N-acetyltransferase [Anaerolineales bacterium]|uniref:GNAT family N-acetyltransferase n=1 Tax=Candidatus Villigracilis affinis TaxID=3140682 RepID=UPI002A197471|nr:GNAT family N-acetyltransferase [Anaerolineales bacterium]MBL0346518.1 GNAT family N-acetyltransferase [Anaerolineales bacterium]